MTLPSPDPILRHAYAYWNSAILASSIRVNLFGYLEAGACTGDELARRASLPDRSVQALLDALLAMAMVDKAGECYSNTPAASAYLVRGRPDYLGGYAAVIQSTWKDWERLSEAVVQGKPLHNHENANPSNSFWEDLVPALAPLGFLPARAAADDLRIAAQPGFRMLDIGGGAGAYSAVWLGCNPNGRSVQIEWPNVNAIARRYVAAFGVADRFETIDGDMEAIDLGSGSYDYVIYANVAHGLSGARNTAMLRKIKRALKPGGTLMIVGLIPNDDRTGHPFALLFHMNMLLNTDEGSNHLRRDYEVWLKEAGFIGVRFRPVNDAPFTLLYAT